MLFLIRSLFNRGGCFCCCFIVVAEAWHLERHPRIVLGYFNLKALFPFLPHAIVMRFHGHDCYVGTFIPETSDLMGL